MRAAVYSIIIGGVLVGAWIFWPRFHGSRPSPIMAAKTQISNFETALAAFQMDNEYYPQGSNGLHELLHQPARATNWHGPYIGGNRLPNDPWRHAYVYECPGKHNPDSFDISSQGSTGEGTIIGNWKP